MKMRTVATIITVFIIAIAGTFTLAWTFGYGNGHSDGLNFGLTQGYAKGQLDTLADVQAIFKAGAVTFNWTKNNDGSYAIQILRFNGNTIMSEVASISASTFNVLNVSGLIGDNHVPPTITTNVDWTFQLAEGTGVRDVSGKSGNQIQDLGNFYVSNLTCARALAGGTGWVYANNGTVYIALGNGTSLAYSDTQLTAEATTNGFVRSTAITPTYASGTGIGNGNYYNFTVTNKFTCATAAMTVNCTSLQWSGVSASNNNIFSEASIGTLPTGQLFNVNDNCTIAWTITVQK